MAQFTFDVPNSQLARVLDGFAAEQGYTGTFNGQAESKQQFLRRRIIEWVKGNVLTAEQRAAAAAANESARQSVESGVAIT